jgi:hypothetical protein
VKAMRAQFSKSEWSLAVDIVSLDVPPTLKTLWVEPTTSSRITLVRDFCQKCRGCQS